MDADFYRALRALADEIQGARPFEPERIVLWPAVPAFGSMRGGQPFTRCGCGNGTFVRYGAVALCYPCAVDAARATAGQPIHAG